MGHSGMSVPCRVLLLQIVLASLLFLLSCQELRASTLPHRRVRRTHDAVEINPLATALEQQSEQERGRNLLESAQQGNLTVVRLLVEAGVNLTTRTDSKLAHTALHLAAMYGHADVIKELLEAGANPNTGDSDRNLPLHYAADGGHTVTRLVERNSDNPKKWQYKSIDPAVPRDYFTVLTLLLSQTSDCDTRGQRGITPLHIAALRSHTSMVRHMVGRGCHMNVTDTNGKTPVYNAAYLGHAETVRALVELGAEVNVQDNRGRSPLHDAVLSKSVETVRVLVENGAQLNVRQEDGETPLAWARGWAHNNETAAYLESRGAAL